MNETARPLTIWIEGPAPPDLDDIYALYAAPDGEKPFVLGFFANPAAAPPLIGRRADVLLDQTHAFRTALHKTNPALNIRLGRFRWIADHAIADGPGAGKPEASHASAG